MEENQQPKPKRRPTKYSKTIADRICAQISEGKSLRSVCAQEGYPATVSVFRWLRMNEEFRNQYERATRDRTEAMAEDILDIADDGSNDYMTITKGDYSYNVEDKEVTSRSKLRVESRKWLMSKMKPKKYGDKIDMTTNGKDLPTPIYGGIATKLNESDSTTSGE